MGDYDYCKKHDCSFLMPEILMCPQCAVEWLMAGNLPEPHGDALIEAIRTKNEQVDKLASFLREGISEIKAQGYCGTDSWVDRAERALLEMDIK